jgi:hypothetical protein
MVATQERAVQYSFRFLVYQEGRYWFAHNLETDIVAEGSDPQEAIADLFRLMAFQLETIADEGGLDAFFRPAPPEFWALFSRAKVINVDNPFPDLASSVEARELVLI